MNKLFLSIGAATLTLLVLLLAFFTFYASIPASSSFFGGTLAVIPIKGTITSGQDSFSGEAGALEVVEQLEAAEEDPAIAGIFLDIDSPGGGVVATKQIVYKIREIEKPVIAYIGEIGASGGYYVASASDYIIADEDSFTGSIGVISMVVNAQGLMELLGIDVNVIAEGEHKAMGNPFTPFEEDDRALLGILLKDTHEQFKKDILSFRNGKLREQDLEDVADGRILSGRQALEIRLIDETTTRSEAIRIAAEQSGIPGKPRLKEFGRTRFSFLDLLVQMGSAFGTGLRNGVGDPRVRILS